MTWIGFTIITVSLITLLVEFLKECLNIIRVPILLCLYDLLLNSLLSEIAIKFWLGGENAIEPSPTEAECCLTLNGSVFDQLLHLCCLVYHVEGWLLIRILIDVHMHWRLVEVLYLPLSHKPRTHPLQLRTQTRHLLKLLPQLNQPPALRECLLLTPLHRLVSVHHQVPLLLLHSYLLLLGLRGGEWRLLLMHGLLLG
jgi:hypothetical protein